MGLVEIGGGLLSCLGVWARELVGMVMGSYMTGLYLQKEKNSDD